MMGQRGYSIFWLGLLLLALVACGDRGPELTKRIALTALPDAIGRGFPFVTVDDTQAAATVNKGAPAPDFTIYREGGDYLTLADLQGQPVVLNFWATWCGPCRKEMPALVAAAAADPDLLVLAVNVQEALPRLQPFAEEFQMTMPVLQDPNGHLRRLYGVRAMPTTIFIDRTGQIAAIREGVLTEELLAEYLAVIK